MIDIIGDFKSDLDLEIKRNVEILCATREGEQALDRDFGLKQNFLDEAGPVAEALFAQEVISKISKYEPRAEIESVNFLPSSDGKLVPEVKIICLT